jgi:AcrR family transcriptional regulator
MAPIAGEQRPMRRHARRNHERLVEAAREVFGEQGVEAPLEAIARRAGVGIATLYRHFATREALVEAIFERRVGELVAVADAALGEADGWAAFAGLLERTLELQAGDRVLKEVFLRHPPPAGRVASVREELRGRFEQVLARAQAQGALRADLTFADLALVLWSLGPVMDATATVAPDAWRRHLDLLLDGLRAQAATPVAQPPLTDDDLHAAMRALRESRRRR